MDAKELKTLIDGLDDEAKTTLKEALGDGDKPTPVGPVADWDMVIAKAAEAGAASATATYEAKLAAEAKPKAEAEEDAAFKLAQAEAAKAGGLLPNMGEPLEYGEKRYFGGMQRRVEYTLNGLLDLTPAEIETSGMKSFVEDFQRFNDANLIASRFLHRDGSNYDMTKTPAYREWWGSKGVQDTIKNKALYVSGSSHTGEDWIASAFSQNFIEAVTSAGAVLSTFQREAIPPGSTTLSWPVEDDSVTLYLQGEPTQDTAVEYRRTTPASAKVTVTPVTLAMAIPYSQEFVEDVTAGAFASIQRSITRRCNLGLEEAIIYGDASGHGFDTGAGYLSDDRRKAFNGLRYMSHVTESAGAEVSAANITWSMAPKLLQPLAIMGNYRGDNPVMLMDKNVSAYLGLLRDGANNLVVTQYAAPQPWLGVNPIFTDALRSDLTSAGIYDASTTSYTAAVFYNPDQFIIGTKRDWTLETQKNILTGQWNIVMTIRLGFKSCQTAATAYTVGYTYGILGAGSW